MEKSLVEVWVRYGGGVGGLLGSRIGGGVCQIYLVVPFNMQNFDAALRCLNVADSLER